MIWVDINKFKSFATGRKSYAYKQAEWISDLRAPGDQQTEALTVADLMQCVTVLRYRCCEVRTS